MIAHPLIAAAVQIAIGLPTGNWGAGALFMSGFYISRELSQAEYRFIEHYNGGTRAGLKWNDCFDRRVWREAKPWRDWILPVAVCTAIFTASRFW